MKKLIKIILVISVAALLYACYPSDDGSVKVGIVLPIEHQAMNEIVAGFKETLQKEYGKPVKIKVANAQGDANIQRAIIQQMRDDDYQVIAAVGMSATQMAMSIAKNRPIVGVAANLPQSARTVGGKCHLALVHDEISPAKELAFIHAAYPELKSITLVHSAADKVYPQVKQAVSAGAKLGILVTPKMINALPDLYSVTNTLPNNTQAIFVLKDNLVVSGIATLAKAARDRHIPLISSDQGSVQQGAGFAVGVKERVSGEKGGKVVAEILNGKKPCDIPIVQMDKLDVFVNQSALIKEKHSLQNIERAAKKFNYNIVDVKKGSQ